MCKTVPLITISYLWEVFSNAIITAVWLILYKCTNTIVFYIYINTYKCIETNTHSSS